MSSPISRRELEQVGDMIWYDGWYYHHGRCDLCGSKWLIFAYGVSGEDQYCQPIEADVYYCGHCGCESSY
jgi:hypothetical protein